MATSTTPDTEKIMYQVVQSDDDFANGAYYGQVIANTSLDRADIVKSICSTRSYLGDTIVGLVLDTLLAEIVKQIGENYYTISLKNSGNVYLTFMPSISGSVASMDAALTEDNKVGVTIRVGEKFNDIMAKAELVRKYDEAKDIVIDRVEDTATGQCGKIGIGNDFVVTGLNLSASRDGEKLELVNLDGTVADTCTIESDDGKGQRIVAKLATLTSDKCGKYKLRLTTHGYSTPLEPLRTFFANVEVKML